MRSKLKIEKKNVKTTRKDPNTMVEKHYWQHAQKANLPVTEQKEKACEYGLAPRPGTERNLEIHPGKTLISTTAAHSNIYEPLP